MSDFRFPDSAEREKRARLLGMLDAGKVMVYVDPRVAGVDLPLQFSGQVAVPLNLSHQFGLEVFEIGPLAVRASLSFGGERHLCVLPYRSMFGLYGHADGTRVLFRDALPPEVALVEAGEETEDSEVPTPEADGPDAAAEPEGDEPKAGGKPPFLRLVE